VDRSLGGSQNRFGLLDERNNLFVPRDIVKFRGSDQEILVELLKKMMETS
jgi:hypothetical protein